MVERLVGSSSWMQLSLLELDSFQHEEHLVFTGMTDTGEVLDQGKLRKLFSTCWPPPPTCSSPPMELQANAQRQLEATLSRRWSSTTSSSSKSATSSKPGPTTASPLPSRPERHQAQAQRPETPGPHGPKHGRRRAPPTTLVGGIEQRRQRQEIFAVEDEIEARRDARSLPLCKTPAPRQPQPKPVCAALERGVTCRQNPKISTRFRHMSMPRTCTAHPISHARLAPHPDTPASTHKKL